MTGADPPGAGGGGLGGGLLGKRLDIGPGEQKRPCGAGELRDGVEFPRLHPAQHHAARDAHNVGNLSGSD